MFTDKMFPFPTKALDYMISGDPTNLTNEEIECADLWLKDWEVVEVRDMTPEEIAEWSNPTRPSKKAVEEFADLEEIEDEYREAI